MSGNVSHWLITQFNLHRPGTIAPHFPPPACVRFRVQIVIHAVCPLSLSLSPPDGVNAASSKLWCKTREGVFLNCGLIFELDVTLTLMGMFWSHLKYNYLGVFDFQILA